MAGNRERRTIVQIDETTGVIDERLTVIARMHPRFEDLATKAREKNLKLVRCTAQLQATLTVHDKDAPKTQDAVNNLLELLVAARELCSAMKQAMDDTESGFKLHPFPHILITEGTGPI